MLERIHDSGLPCFVPTKPCFEYDNSLLGSLLGHCDVINDIDVSEDGNLLYSVANDNTLRYVDFILIFINVHPTRLRKIKMNDLHKNWEYNCENNT